MTAQEKILERVRAALAPLPKRAPLPDWEPELAIMRRLVAGRDPWELFAERLVAVNGRVYESVKALAEALVQQGARVGYCDPTLWPHLREIFSDFGLHVETAWVRAQVDRYEFGITWAAGAIAETGTLILTDGASPTRLGALAPWIHVAVVRTEEIYPDLQQAVAALPTDPNVIWATGPSKTADVEGILIEGVHGPGQQWALPWPPKG